MGAITVRNLSAEVHRALKLRAAQHGRSTEAEVRVILEEAVKPASRIKLGSALAALGDKFGLDIQIPERTEQPRFATFE